MRRGVERMAVRGRRLKHAAIAAGKEHVSAYGHVSSREFNVPKPI